MRVFQITYAVDGRRVQMASLAPLVPRIEGDDAIPGWALEDQLFLPEQRPAKSLRMLLTTTRPNGWPRKPLIATAGLTRSLPKILMKVLI